MSVFFDRKATLLQRNAGILDPNERCLEGTSIGIPDKQALTLDAQALPARIEFIECQCASSSVALLTNGLDTTHLGDVMACVKAGHSGGNENKTKSPDKSGAS